MANRLPIISTSPLTAPLAGTYTATVSNGGIIGTAGGMPVYGAGSTVCSSPPIAICSTAHARFNAGAEQQSSRYKMMFQLGGSTLFSEVAVTAIHWDIGVLPGEAPLAELVRAFEEGEDDIHTDPMGIIGAGVWCPVVGPTFGQQVPMSYGMPSGPLPKTQWCRAGLRLPRPLVVPVGQGFYIEVGFTRKWAPSRDVDLTFTLELA